MKALNEARDAIAQGDVVRGLEKLLIAWRSVRSTEIADRIEAVSPRAAEHAPKVEGKQLKEKQARWLEIAEKGQAASLHELLSSIASVKTPQGVERLDALKHFEADPRIGRALAKVFADLPFQGATTMPYWRKLFPLIVVHGDARARDVLRSLVGASLKRTGNAASISEFFERNLERTLGALDESLVPVPLEEDDARALAEIDALLAQQKKAVPAAARDLGALYDAVYADPGDTAKRLILADALLEAGDPRGEFISLQCQASLDEKATKRVTALVNKHGKDWIGNVARVATKQSLVFRRGFLAECEVFWKKEGDVDAAVDAKEWSTLEAVVGSSGMHVHPKLARSPHLRGVKRLGTVQHDAAVEILDDASPRPLEEIHVFRLNNRPFDDAHRRVLADPRGAPKLRAFSLALHENGYEPYRFLLAGPIARRVDELGLRVRNQREVNELLAMLATIRPAPTCAVWIDLYYTNDSLRLSISRDAAGDRSVFDLHLRGEPPPPHLDRRYEMVANSVRALPSHAITVFRVHGPSHADPAPLRDALAKQTLLTEASLT